MEHWDELWPGGFRFRFDDNVFKPSTDTFLLGGFAQVRRGERVCDLGAGIGLPGLMLLSREPEVHITDIDIDETACALARRSAEANGLAERIRIIQADLRRREQLPPGGSFDVCVANPPYFPPHTGRVAEGSRGVQRAELQCTMDELCAAAAYLLRSGGLVVDLNAHTVTVDGARVALTYKEFELLRLFLSHPGMAFTRDQLFQEVWGMDFCGETRTVDMHIRTLRQKLGPYGWRIETVRNVGYRMEATT